MSLHKNENQCYIVSLKKLFFLSFILISSCSNEKRDIENVVRQYIRLLAKAYSNTDTEVLKNVVTQKQKNRIQQFILYMLKNNELMKCNIKKIDVNDIEIKKTEIDKRAVVKAEERWSCDMFDARNRTLLQKDELFIYRINYHLKKEGNKWLVYLVKGEQIDEKGNIIDVIDPTLPEPWKFLSDE